VDAEHQQSAKAATQGSAQHGCAVALRGTSAGRPIDDPRVKPDGLRRSATTPAAALPLFQPLYKRPAPGPPARVSPHREARRGAKGATHARSQGRAERDTGAWRGSGAHRSWATPAARGRTRGSRARGARQSGSRTAPGPRRRRPSARPRTRPCRSRARRARGAPRLASAPQACAGRRGLTGGLAPARRPRTAPARPPQPPHRTPCPPPCAGAPSPAPRLPLPRARPWTPASLQTPTRTAAATTARGRATRLPPRPARAARRSRRAPRQTRPAAVPGG